MGLGFVLILMRTLSEAYLSFVFVLIGVLSAYQIPVIYKASCYVKENATALCTACANMIIMIFGYFFHSSIGALMDFSKKSAPLYEAKDYLFSISIIPLALFLAGLGFLLVYRKERREKTL